MDMMTIIIIGGLIVVGLIVLAMIFTSLYKRSKKEQAFVRTGFGGEKVVFNGGMLVFPILHEISAVKPSVQSRTLPFSLNVANVTSLFKPSTNKKSLYTPAATSVLIWA